MLDSPNFGTHKLICLKHRHLGSNYYRAVQPVRMEDDTLQKNAIFLSFENFTATEVGDLQDLVDSQGSNADINLSNASNELPEI